ncbi:unnamed protein product [Auanema sp. JU1783]|nr:unnamed protein product [Auanema sp. JU1783]
MNDLAAVEALKASRDDLNLMFQTWPDNFASLFDMGLRAFERLFSYRPHLKTYFSLPEDDEGWRKDERIKRIVLSLEQTLADAVATYADPNPDPADTQAAFLETLQEIGGLHRAIVPNISPDNFELLFKLLPEVIADVISSRRKEGPLSQCDRQRLLGIWASITLLMSRHFVLGWERRIVPKTPKFSKAYRSEQSEKGQRWKFEWWAARRKSSTASYNNSGSHEQHVNTSFSSGGSRGTQSSTSSTSDSSYYSCSQNEVRSTSQDYTEPLAIHEVECEIDDYV